MRHLISPLDFSVEELDKLLDLANDIENNPDKYELDIHSKQYQAYEDTHKLLWEQIEEPTKDDVKQLMEANKKWVGARTMIPVNEKVQQWANKKR